MSLPFKYTVYGKNFFTTERNGRRENVSEKISFQGDTQSMSSSEIISVTGGRLSTGMITVFSEEKLNISRDGDRSQAKGTYVLFENSWYEIVGEMSNNTQIPELTSINHYEYLAEYREREVS